MRNVCTGMKLMSPHGATVTLEGGALWIVADCPGKSHVAVKDEDRGGAIVAVVPNDWVIVLKPPA